MNAVDALGETALHRAAAAGQISACRILITHGADVSLRSFQGHTAAEVASEPVQKILHGKQSNLFCNNLQLFVFLVCSYFFPLQHISKMQRLVT